MADEPDPSTLAVERKLATILSADVAEYSRLMAEDEEQTVRVFRGHKQIFESLVVLHRGRVFNTAGDAILAEFPSAVEAVRCATEIQAALRTRNDQLAPSRQVRFRIGANLGDVMVQGTDLLGDGVNVAARLQAAAEPGGVCISGSVYDQIRNKLSLSFKSLGERNFKNIPQPVRTFTIAETEEHGALPTPPAESPRARPSYVKWAAAALLVLVAVGAMWGYVRYQDDIADESRKADLTARREARQATARVAVEAARIQAEADRVRAQTEARRSGDAARLPAEPSAPQQMASAASVPPPPPPQAASNGMDGAYAGPICYGEGRIDPARCFRGLATVSDGKISGQWPTRDTGITMYVTGTVTPNGEATIEMHTRNPAGIALSTINLSGTVHDGQLDASGAFLNGRSATINWHRN